MSAHPRIDPRRLLATGGTIALVAVGTVVAVGANVGLFSLADSRTEVGRLQPVAVARETPTTSADPTVVTVFIDDPAPPAGTPPARQSPAPRADDDAQADARVDAPDAEPSGVQPTTTTVEHHESEPHDAADEHSHDDGDD